MKIKKSTLKSVFILCCVVLLGWSCGGKNKAEEAAKLTEEAATYAAGEITEEVYEQQLKDLRESAAKFELQVKKTSKDVAKVVQ